MRTLAVAKKIWERVREQKPRECETLEREAVGCGARLIGRLAESHLSADPTLAGFIGRVQSVARDASDEDKESVKMVLSLVAILMSEVSTTERMRLVASMAEDTIVLGAML